MDGLMRTLGYYLATALAVGAVFAAAQTVESRIHGPARVAAGYTVSVGMLLAVTALVRPPTGPVRAAGRRVSLPTLLIVASLLLLFDLFARKIRCVSERSAAVSPHLATDRRRGRLDHARRQDASARSNAWPACPRDDLAGGGLAGARASGLPVRPLAWRHAGDHRPFPRSPARREVSLREFSPTDALPPGDVSRLSPPETTGV